MIKKYLKTILAVLVTIFAAQVYAEQPKKVPPKKVKVTKPCKAGQTEADGCHVVKKLEKPKPKPQPAKKQAAKK
jgi:hypothetical protein